MRNSLKVDLPRLLSAAPCGSKISKAHTHTTQQLTTLQFGIRVQGGRGLSRAKRVQLQNLENLEICRRLVVVALFYLSWRVAALEQDDVT